MITGEISWAIVAIALAWSGAGIWPLHESYLHSVLDRRNYDSVWLAVIGAPAVLLIYFSIREYLAHSSPHPEPGKRWFNEDYRRSALIRGRLCFALTFSWIYIVYMMTRFEGRPSAITPIAIGGAVMCLWFWVENRRVQRECRKQNNDFTTPITG